MVSCYIHVQVDELHRFFDPAETPEELRAAAAAVKYWSVSEHRNVHFALTGGSSLIISR
jgi:hypothetical protein